TARSDRSLALSHGARLVFERLGVWSEVAAAPGAVTAITAVDVSQRDGFGAARLEASEQGVPALGYVVSYRALQSALDAALSRAGASVEHGVAATEVDPTPAHARVRGERDGGRHEWTARLAAIADGGGDLVAGSGHHRHDYRQVAVTAKLWVTQPHQGVAFERFTPEGPMALLPEDDRYGLVWTTTPMHGDRLLTVPEDEFLAALSTRFGSRVGGFLRCADRRMFPLSLEFARHVASPRTVLLGNAAQALHPVAGQGFNLGVRDAYELAQALLSSDRDAIGSAASLASYARRRLADRWTGIAFTHGLLGVFGNDYALLRWPRGLALTLVDAVPPLKRIFTRAMLYGLH
ncbi:MAG TPA: FAD-dependent monooxygenase, partial [Casimicrobiaceae bacterium]|nr:FAD-dependent monooxygenase [Casimicrobiaceae bacterium]